MLAFQVKMVVAAAAGIDDIQEDDVGPADADFDYLLSMSIQSLTMEKVILILPH